LSNHGKQADYQPMFQVDMETPLPPVFGKEIRLMFSARLSLFGTAFLHRSARKYLALQEYKMNLQPLLDLSSRDHDHLCPRQILGVRMGLAGMKVLGFDAPPDNKQLLVITETDGCFADGLSAATGCTVGHRTLRVEDYGKPAGVFVGVKTKRAVRVAPAIGIRQRAFDYSANESPQYFAQMQAYQVMPDDEMFTVQEVALNTPIEQIVSRPGLRVDCGICGEEIMNEREVRQNGMTVCYTCAHGGYYRLVEQDTLRVRCGIPLYACQHKEAEL